MELFHFLQKIYKATGTYPLKINQSCSLNIRNLFYSISLILFFISTTAFLIFDASTVIELTETYFISLTILAVTANFFVHFWKTVNALDLIAKFEEFIKKSKLKNSNKIYRFKKNLKFIEILQ